MGKIRRMILVEDESLISMMLEDFLDTMGIEVVGTAQTVEEALALVSSVQADAAILDVNLRNGERSGAVADLLDAMSIPYLISSGGPADAASGRPMLGKPFSLDALERAVAAL